MSNSRRWIAALCFLLIGILASCSDPDRSAKQGPGSRINQGAPDGATLLASKVAAIARFIADDRPSLPRAMDLLGGTIDGPGNKRYAEVRGSGFRAVVTLAEQAGDRIVVEVSIYPDSEIGLRFKDLTAVLGDWDREKVIQSKTSHVQFPYASRSDVRGMVYVVLAFPPADPASPVLSVKIRREHSSGQDE